MAALSDQARMLEERRAEIAAGYKVKEDKEKQLVELNDTGKSSSPLCSRRLARRFQRLKLAS